VHCLLLDLISPANAIIDNPYELPEEEKASLEIAARLFPYREMLARIFKAILFITYFLPFKACRKIFFCIFAAIKTNNTI